MAGHSHGAPDGPAPVIGALGKAQAARLTLGPPSFNRDAFKPSGIGEARPAWQGRAAAGGHHVVPGLHRLARGGR
ncbi:MAG: hypothetical protein ACK55J_03795, partial [Alphaproteobacteria bacterium]